MDLVRFGCLLLVLVLALGAVAPAPACDCNSMEPLKLTEQSCLLNQLLRVISHLVSCSQKPVVTPESYRRLLEATNCTGQEEERVKSVAVVPTTTQAAPTIPIITTKMDWLGPVAVVTESPATETPTTESSSEEETNTPTSLDKYFSHPRVPFPVTLFPPTADGETTEDEEDSSEEDVTVVQIPAEPTTQVPVATPAPVATPTEKPEPVTIPVEEIHEITIFELPPVSEKVPPSFTSPPIITPPILTPPPDNIVTEVRPEVTTVVSKCDEPAKKEKKEDDIIEENGLPFRAETFFIPVLKFHGAPCMSSQDLKDYLFRCLPLPKEENKKHDHEKC